MTETLLDYYATKRAQHRAPVEPVVTVAMHKPTHRAPGDFNPCTPVQTNYEGTNWAYWCTRHDGGLHRPDAECHNHPTWV